MLDKPRAEYVQWIRLASSWGGALELSILAALGSSLGADAGLPSRFSDLEIVALDIRSGVEQRYGRFGANGDERRRSSACFLLYDGVHYDPLVLAPGLDAVESSADRTCVAPDDESSLALAMACSSEARASHAFTDTSNFAIKCLVCGAGLRGQDDAQQHAAATGHTNFAQTGN